MSDVQSWAVSMNPALAAFLFAVVPDKQIRLDHLVLGLYLFWAYVFWIRFELRRR